MKKKIRRWVANNLFWSSVIIIFLISIMVILVFAPISIFSFFIWIFWRILDCAKYPLIAGITILKFLQELVTGDISHCVETAILFVGGIILYPGMFIGELISDMGKRDFAQGFALLLSTYAIVGSIFWSRTVNRQGMTLISVGTIYGIGVITAIAYTLSKNNTNETNPAFIIIAFVVISAACLFFGIRWYLKYKKILPKSGSVTASGEEGKMK